MLRLLAAQLGPLGAAAQRQAAAAALLHGASPTRWLSAHAEPPVEEGGAAPACAEEGGAAEAPAAGSAAGQAAAPPQQEGGAAAAATPRLQTKEWRSWIDDRLDKQLEDFAEQRGEAAQPRRSQQPSTSAASAAARAQPPPKAAAPAAAAAAGPRLPHMALKQAQQGTLEQQVTKIVVPGSSRGGEEGADGLPAGVEGFAQLAHARDAPRIFPGGATKADEVSPLRLHPYRVFYPGQTYSPEDLDPYKAQDVGNMATSPFHYNTKKPVGPEEVQRQADFRGAQFLSGFVTEAGKLMPRRKTHLRAKLHRHLCRQIKIARMMAILPPTSKLEAYSGKNGRGPPKGANRSGPPPPPGPPDSGPPGGAAEQAAR